MLVLCRSPRSVTQIIEVLDFIVSSRVAPARPDIAFKRDYHGILRLFRATWQRLSGIDSVTRKSSEHMLA